MNQDWVTCDEIKITQYVNQIHCDTRDFNCLTLEKKLNKKDKDEKELLKLINNKNIDDNCLINQSDIVEWLKMLDNISRNGKNDIIWRFLCFDSYKKEPWFKYIRLYRYNDDKFIVCDLHNSPVEWQTLNKDTLNQTYLNAYE